MSIQLPIFISFCYYNYIFLELVRFINAFFFCYLFIRIYLLFFIHITSGKWNSIFCVFISNTLFAEKMMKRNEIKMSREKRKKEFFMLIRWEKINHIKEHALSHDIIVNSPLTEISHWHKKFSLYFPLTIEVCRFIF